MKGQSVSLILSILIYAAIFVPVVSAETETKALLMTIIFRLPVFFIVLFLNLNSGLMKKNQRGWKSPHLIDWILIPLLVILTLVLGMVFSMKRSPVVYSIEAWPLLALLALIIAVVEEGYFRSWLLTEMPRLGVPSHWALVVSILLFSLAHAWQGLTGVVFAALIGVLYGAVFLWRKNIIILIVSHAVYDLLAMLSAIIR
jgi:membrane protease YdiL (CAAX protease family)